MARRRYGRRHSRRGMKIPIVSLAILAGQVMAANDGTIAGTLGHFGSYYTGFDFGDRSFHPENLLIGYAPWIAKRFILPIARPRLGGMHLPVSIS